MLSSHSATEIFETLASIHVVSGWILVESKIVIRTFNFKPKLCQNKFYTNLVFALLDGVLQLKLFNNVLIFILFKKTFCWNNLLRFSSLSFLGWKWIFNDGHRNNWFASSLTSRPRETNKWMLEESLRMIRFLRNIKLNLILNEVFLSWVMWTNMNSNSFKPNFNSLVLYCFCIWCIIFLNNIFAR